MSPVDLAAAQVDNRDDSPCNESLDPLAEQNWFGYEGLSPDVVMDIMNHFGSHSRVLSAYERLSHSCANALEVVRTLEIRHPYRRFHQRRGGQGPQCRESFQFGDEPKERKNRTIV